MVSLCQAALRYANKIDKSVTACPPLMALEHVRIPLNARSNSTLESSYT